MEWLRLGRLGSLSFKRSEWVGHCLAAYLSYLVTEEGRHVLLAESVHVDMFLVIQSRWAEVPTHTLSSQITSNFFGEHNVNNIYRQYSWVGTFKRWWG